MRIFVKITDLFLNISIIALILCILCIALYIGDALIKSVPYVDIENYTETIDYGILSEEQIETFDNILYAVQNNESVVNCPSYSKKEQHEISTQLGLYFGDPESIWDLIYWHDNHAILNLDTFNQLLNQKVIIDARVDEAVSTLIEGSDEYKLLQISNYIAAKITYTDGFRDIIIAFNGKGVCSTYSMLFYKMATRLGIQTYICYGYAGDAYHSWNMIELDGERIYFDITWYDDYVHNVRYIFKKYSWNTMDVMNNTPVIYGEYRFVKVSDYAPSYEEMSKSEGYFEHTDEYGLWREMHVNNGVQTLGKNILVEYTNDLMCASIIEAGEIEGLGVVFPETGLYALDLGTLENRDVDIIIEAVYIPHGTIYRDGDYEYVYNKIDSYYGEIVDGWAVTLAIGADRSKVSYDKILKSIDGRHVKVLDETFYYCNNMIHVPEIPDSITIIGKYCFSNCRNLTNVIIPNGIKIIGYKAFQDSGLTSITIPESVTFIGSNAFALMHNVSVNYSGTVSQWNAINLEQDWNKVEGMPGRFGVTEVICSDGVVSLV